MNVSSKSTLQICRPGLAKVCWNLLLATTLFNLAFFNLRADTIADWKFNEANPTADSSSNNNTLALNGDALSFTGDIATNDPGVTNSITFDGASYLQTVGTLNLSLFKTITIEFFAKYTPSGGLEMFYAQNNPNNVMGAFYFDLGESSSSGLKFAERSPSGFETDVAPGPTDGNWHHFAVTIDESSNSPVVETYLDGYEVNNAGLTASLQPFINDYFTIGAYPPDYDLNYSGEMGEMRISSGVLPPYEFLIGAQPVVISISQQPANTAAVATNPAVFSVVATDQGGDPTPPIQYQWQMNGTNISGATNSSYTISSASQSDNGDSFDVVLSAGAASITSSNAILTITTNVTSNVAIADWKFNAASPTADSSGNGNTLALNGDALSFTSDVDTNDPGATNSITFDGASYLQTVGTLNLSLYKAITIEFFAKYTPSGGLEMFYAQNNPNNVMGAFYLDVGESSSSGLKFADRAASGFETDTAPGPTDGNWHHFAVTIDESSNSPVVKTYLDGYEVDNAGVTASLQPFINDYFTIGAYPPGYNLNYNGEMGEMRISKGVLPPYEFLIGAQPVMISISQQPASASVVANNPAAFSVVAAALGGNPTPPIQYQWQMNGTNISGATNSSYTISSASQTDNGDSFDVVLSAGTASITSSNAILTVSANPTIADWKFNAANPTADSSGNSNILALNGDALSFTSDVDTNDPGATNSITFDGASYLQTVGTLNLSLYKAITIELFAKYTPSGGLEMFYAQNNPNNVMGAFYLDVGESSSSGLKFAERSPSGFETDTAPGPTDSNWHHFAVTIDESSNSPVVKTYLDGYEVDNAGVTASLQPFINDYFTIGAYPPDYDLNYNGEMGEMRISNGVLPPYQFLIGVQPVVVSISHQPANTAAVATNAAVFSVVATAQGGDPTPPIQYQWQMNGINISGATNSSYTIASASQADNGDSFDVVLSAGAASITSSNAILTVLPASMIADWKFNAANPTADSSGNGNTLAFNGDALSFTGDVDTNDPGVTNSITFDGASYLQTVGTLNLSLYKAITIEFFAKYTPSGGLEMFYAQNNPNNVLGAFYFDLGESSSSGLKLAERAASGFETDTAPGPTDGNWHHFAVTIDESGNSPVVKTYLDGYEVDNAGVTASLHPFINDYFTIGAYPPAYNLNYNGEMGEMRIFNGVLNPEQFLSGPARLQIGSSSGKIVISWPQNAINFRLQQSSSLLGPWTNVTISPVSSGLNYQVSVPATSGTEFYRLVR